MIEIIPYGDHALLVNLEQVINPDINKTITSLANSLKSAAISGVEFIIPAYCSITISYDTAQIDFGSLKETILLINNNLKVEDEMFRKMRIPVCYDLQFSPDIEDLEKSKGMDKHDLIKLHCANQYRVYMLGFLPGFPYMGANPESLTVNRKESPRIRIPARSVGLAGEQTGIYPLDSPGGWQIIGKTPLEIILDHNSFLFQPGDMVKFYKISAKEYDAIRKEVKERNFDLDSLYE